MFRIGVLELAITCALIVLAILIPLIIMRGYAKLTERINKLEDKLTKKE